MVATAHKLSEGKHGGVWLQTEKNYNIFKVHGSSVVRGWSQLRVNYPSDFGVDINRPPSSSQSTVCHCQVWRQPVGWSSSSGWVEWGWVGSGHRRCRVGEAGWVRSGWIMLGRVGSSLSGLHQATRHLHRVVVGSQRFSSEPPVRSYRRLNML
jgi:hypothetical protein